MGAAVTLMNIYNVRFEDEEKKVGSVREYVYECIKDTSKEVVADSVQEVVRKISEMFPDKVIISIEKGGQVVI